MRIRKKPKTLGDMCMQNKGKCCEERTPPSLEEKDILLIKKLGVEDHFQIDGDYATTKGQCYFLNEGLCGIYEQRSTDCRAYPVSFRLDSQENIEYVIDMNCPAVEEGLVTGKFIQDSIKLWKESNPSIEWMGKYNDADNPEKYDFWTIDDYMCYKKTLKYFLLVDQRK